MALKSQNRYGALVEEVFRLRYSLGDTEVPFTRQDIETAAAKLSLRLPNNVADVLYSFRFRNDLPQSITDTQPAGLAWRIELAGRGKYRFALRRHVELEPDTAMEPLPIPDATPAAIRFYAMDDEQALLAILRYNRLIDVFLELTAYSLQNHLRTTVPGVGQIEIDELYIGVDRDGIRYVVPVQAKSGSDRVGAVQAEQDIAFARTRFPDLICRPVSARFLVGGAIALMELDSRDGDLYVKAERHYRLTNDDGSDAA